METYIKRLSLKNFQSHRETDFEFEPGLNIIVGPSDQGKSSVIRAMRWLIFNEPRGTGFIRVGETRCQVRMELCNGVVVERIRDESNRTNRYLLEIPGEEAMVFEGFNREVPLEIRQALGIQKMVIDHDRAIEVNLATQLESPFLLNESGTTRSKILGRMANLHIIDAAQRETLRDNSQALQEITRLEAEVKALEIQLQDYIDLEEEETRLKNLENLLKRWSELDHELQLLEELHSRLEHNRTQMVETSKILKQLDHIDEAYETQVLMGNLVRKLHEIRELQDQRNKGLEEIRSCQETIESSQGLARTEEWLEQVKNLRQEGFMLQTTRKELTNLEREERHKSKELNGYEIILESLKGIDGAEEAFRVFSETVVKLELFQGFSDKRRDAVREIKKAQQELQTSDSLVRSLAEKYGDLLQNAGRCPTCFAEINQDTIARIQREIL